MTPGDGGAATIEINDADAGGDVVAVIGEYTKYVTYIQSGEKPPLFVNVPPLPARPLLGRDALLADLADRLIAGQSPALSTAGMPGVGKTSLAVALAHHRRLQRWRAVGWPGPPARCGQHPGRLGRSPGR